MIKKDLLELNIAGMEERESLARMKEFIEDRDWHRARVLVMYGLPETGKDMLVKQLLAYYKDIKYSVYEVQETDTMDDIYDFLEEKRDSSEREQEIIWFQEMTRAKDFIRNSACLADIFTASFRIIVSGTDSLAFYKAKEDELFDRTVDIHTNHIPFTEHCRLLGSKSIDEYIRYGGVLYDRPGDGLVHDYDSAYDYVDKYVSENIYRSARAGDEYDRNEAIKTLSLADLKVFVHEIVSCGSGVLAKDKMQELLKKAAEDENHSIHEILEFIEDGFFGNLDSKRYQDKISDELYDAVRRVAGNRLNYVYNTAAGLDEYLKRLDVLSSTAQENFINEEGPWGRWCRASGARPYHVVQPAVKYCYLQKAREFIEWGFYKMLPKDKQDAISKALDAKIRQDMLAGIVLFDAGRMLAKVKRKEMRHCDRYETFKLVFRDDGKLCGGFDLLVYDRENMAHWVFLVEHSSEPSCGREEYFYDNDMCAALKFQFGEPCGFAVLYNGVSQVASSGTPYLNIYDFLSSVERNRDMGKAFAELTESIQDVVHP